MPETIKKDAIKVVQKTILSEFVNSVKKVLHVTAGETIVHEITYLDKNQNLPGDISSKIELEGDLCGIVAVSFPKDYAQLVTSKIIGCEIEELSDDDICDGVSEIVNQVTGNVRTDLSQYGYQIEISIPQVINGSIKQVPMIPVNPVHIIVFQTLETYFSVQINLREKNFA